MTNYDLQSEIEKAIQLLEEDIADAVAEERAAVVVYLLTRGGIAADLADDIERGEHRREEEP